MRQQGIKAARLDHFDVGMPACKSLNAAVEPVGTYVKRYMEYEKS